MNQKLNVRSSTEGLLLGYDYILCYVLWGNYFIEAQGYTVQSNVLFQENKLTMLLENNGRISSGKSTKHISARCFLIVDNIEKRGLEIQHYPTKHIWDDVLNNPKQGNVFGVFRSHLMKVPEEYDDDK